MFQFQVRDFSSSSPRAGSRLLKFNIKFLNFPSAVLKYTTKFFESDCLSHITSHLL